MVNISKIALLKGLIETAETNLRSSKQIIADICADEGINLKNKKNYTVLADELAKSKDDDEKIIEGVFDGQNMIGPKGKIYPVPANYASKSKLVAGDILKLTIEDDGSFIYKQIGPILRRRVKGPLVFEGSQYHVLAEGKSYKVLLASVTYFHCQAGDEVTILVPELEDSEWGAIEHSLPKIEYELEDKSDIEEKLESDLI
jgi:uncharacterized protein YrzB (UPF0473 family)